MNMRGCFFHIFGFVFLKLGVTLAFSGNPIPGVIFVGISMLFFWKIPKNYPFESSNTQTTKTSNTVSQNSIMSEQDTIEVEKQKSWEDKLREMDGYEFEEFVAKLFEEMGYETRVTKKSGDQGVDVIAENPFEALAIQAKNLSGKVSNSAVQEIVAAKNPSKADKAIVVTTSNFTRSAKQLAKANNVRLVDREELLDLVDEYM